MLKIKTLTFCNIGRFVESQTIDFEQLSDLNQVNGISLDPTRGSSGVGKSTIFNSLDYLFGLNDLPVTVLQSRFSKDPITVSATFDYNGTPLTITRNKKGLTIDLGGDIVEGSSKLSEEKLDQIIGMPRELFSKILHKRQKSGGFFLDMGPKKTYEFFISCLNHQELLKKANIADIKYKELDNAKSILLSDLASKKEAKSAIQTSLLSIGSPPIKSMSQDTVTSLKSKYDQDLFKHNEIVESHKEQNSILDKQRPVLLSPPELKPQIILPSPTLKSSILDNSAIIDQYNIQISNLKEEIQSIVDREKQRVQVINNSIQERKLLIPGLTHSISAANMAKASALAIANEIKKIRDSICPTCEQNWATETAKNKEEELIEKLTNYKKQIEVGIEDQKSLDVLVSEITNLELQKAPIEYPELSIKNKEITYTTSLLQQEKVKAYEYNFTVTAENALITQKHNEEQRVVSDEISNHNQSLLAEVSLKNKALSEEYNKKTIMVREFQKTELDQVRGQADVSRMAFEAAANQLKSYEEQRTRYETTLNSMKIQENTYTNSIMALELSLQEITEKILLIDELRKGIKTYISCSFDDALESISDMATKILRGVANMANGTIQLESQKETKEGKVKEEVNIVLHMDGELNIPIKSLSGGERSSVDIAIDMAVVLFIEEKTGSGIDLMILDEPLDGLDLISSEMVLEVLKQSNLNKRLILVSHNDTLKEMVDSTITVVRDGNTSYLKQGA